MSKSVKERAETPSVKQGIEIAPVGERTQVPLSYDQPTVIWPVPGQIVEKEYFRSGTLYDSLGNSAIVVIKIDEEKMALKEGLVNLAQIVKIVTVKFSYGNVETDIKEYCQLFQKNLAKGDITVTKSFQVPPKKIA